MRIGILGVAHMHVVSYVHALKNSPDVTIVGVTDVDHSKSTHFSEQWGVPQYDSAEQLAQDSDAVIVCSENALHADLVVLAAAHGCHVLCEKPIATTREDAKRMLDACESAGVIFQTAFPMRFSTPIVEAKSIVDSGKLGKIVAIKGTNRGSMPGGWFIDQTLSGGGAVLDHTVHVVDLMRWFLGANVADVYAEVDTRFHEIDIDDCGTLMMTFTNGTVATLDPSWSRAKSFPTWGDVTMEIIGTEGVLTVDAFAQHQVLYSDTSMSVQWPSYGDDSDSVMVEEFLSAIRERRAPLVTGWDGYYAMEVAIAAYASTKEHQPVSLRPIQTS